MAVPEYFCLAEPDAERLLAVGDRGAPYQLEKSTCPLTADHYHNRRVTPLGLQVKHDSRDEVMISAWGGERVVHASLVAEFERRGFSGYRLQPATVRFADGTLSNDYSELLVVGWAGIARPESGIRLLDECPGCLRRSYSALQNAEAMIDWRQWSGDDFFVVWPLPVITFITPRLAGMLKSLQVKSYTLATSHRFEEQNVPAPSPLTAFLVGRLSDTMPADMAAKHGQSLGLG